MKKLSSTGALLKTYISRVSVARMGTLTSLSGRTWERRQLAPGDLTLSELKQLQAACGLSNDEVCALVLSYLWGDKKTATIG